MLEANVDAEVRPPNFALVIERFKRAIVDVLFKVIPVVEILLHTIVKHIIAWATGLLRGADGDDFIARVLPPATLLWRQQGLCLSQKP